MRIHTELTRADIYAAMAVSRTYALDISEHRSRKRSRAFNVLLRGNSKRRPNGGSGDADEYTATWDQWGVFLAYLFEKDPNMFTPYDASAEAFHARTGNRFQPRKQVGQALTYIDTDSLDGPTVYWPSDAHGDHNFQYQGISGEQSCTKCSAVQRWAS